MEDPSEMNSVTVPTAPRAPIGLEGMNEGYDQSADPPSYSQATKDAQPGYPEPPPVLGAYPGVAPQVAVTQQPVYSNNVLVQQAPPPVLHHDSYMVWSVVSCLCCFWPLGLIAIIFSSLSRDDAISGRLEQARTHARVALGLNVASLLAGIVFYIIIVVSYNHQNDHGYK